MQVLDSHQFSVLIHCYGAKDLAPGLTVLARMQAYTFSCSLIQKLIEQYLSIYAGMLYVVLIIPALKNESVRVGKGTCTGN